MDDAGDVLPVWAALRHARSKKARDNNVMHAKPDLRVFLKWMIAGSGSVITDVIRLENWAKIHLGEPNANWFFSLRIRI